MNLFAARIEINLRCLIALFIFLVGQLTGHALDPRYRISQYAHSIWRLKDGIFPGVPNAIAQTADGYVWIGTGAGLLRFDGVSFQRLDDSEGAKFPDADLQVKALLAARDGSLWVGTSLGMIQIIDGAVKQVLKQDGPTARLFEDRDGTIWKTRERLHDFRQGSLCRLDGQRLTCFGSQAGFPVTAANSVVQNAAGELFVAIVGGLVRFRNEVKQIYSMPGATIGDQAWLVDGIALNEAGQPVVAVDHSGQGGGVFTLIDDKWKPLAIKGGNHAGALFRDHTGTLWVGTEDNGVFRICGERIDHFNREDGLSGDSVAQIMEDHEGNVWVVTTQGIDNFRATPLVQFGEREGLHQDEINAITEGSNGSVWVSTPKSLENIHANGVTTLSAGNGLPGEMAESLLVDHRGRLWVGVDGSLYVQENGRFRLVVRTKGKQMANSMAEDAQGDIWVSFSGPTGSLVRIHDDRLEHEFLPPEVPGLFSVVRDAKGTIWLGLFSERWLHWVDDRWNEVTFKSLDWPKQKLGAAYNITADPDGTLWGMTPHGVVGYKDNVWRLLSVRNGLPCDFTYSAAVDAHGALWVFSQCGLAHIQRAELKRWWQQPQSKIAVQYFDTVDGVQPGAPAERPPVARSSDGRLWFSNGSTLQVVDPDHLTSHAESPPVELVRAVIDGNSVAARSLLRVPPAARNIEIDYTALSFTMPQRVRFKYQLHGYDADWQQPGTRRSAFYSNLKPGSYRFQVIATNESGIWSPTGRSIEVIIEPAWYQTRWFISACALMAALLLYALYWQRMRQVRHRLKLQYDARLEERTRVARDLHDTLLQTVQGTKLVAEEALHGADDPTQLHNVVTKIHEWLSRAVIEGRAALTALRSGSSAGDLAHRLRDAAEECTEKHGIKLEFEIVGTPAELIPNATEEMFRIGYEAIRNACAHSKASILAVQLRYGRTITLVVRDNGIGFSPQAGPAAAPGHYGLAGMRERAKHLGATLEVRSTPNAGTKVTLTARAKKNLSTL